MPIKEDKKPVAVVSQEGVATKTVEVPAGSKVVVEKKITKDTPATEPTLRMFQLVENWRKQFLTYSFIFTAITFIVGAAGFFLPLMGLLQPVLTPETFGIIMFVLSALAGLSKFIKQKKLHKEVIVLDDEESGEGNV